ncbi:Uncharacterised protein [Mycobacteroides abscessus subsp. abscessus]|nr:Uncharacterised protein [Mycobacteroides abscessus subsp. abscessus]
MVLRDNADDPPTETFKQLKSLDVLHILAPIRPMLITVVLDTHHHVLPTHVDVGEWDVVAVVDQDLSLRTRQTRCHEHQP